MAVQKFSKSTGEAGWIFSPAMDCTVFLLPCLVGYAVGLSFPHLIFNSSLMMMNVFVGSIFLTRGHVFSTMAPLFKRFRDRELNGALVIGPVLLILVSVALLQFNRQLFYVLLAPYAMYHLMSQQYGWVMLSRRRAGEPSSTRLADQIAIWNVMLFGVIWWLSPMSEAPKFFYRTFDIPYTIPSVVAQSALVVHWAINAAYVVFVLRQPQKNYPKLFLIFTTWLLYSTFFFFHTNDYFKPIQIYVHCLAYNLHCGRPSSSVLPGRWAKISGVIVLLGAGIFGWLWIHSNGKIKAIAGYEGSVWEIGLWVPLLLHYYFDAIIWRKPVERAEFALPQQKPIMLDPAKMPLSPL